MKNKSKFKFPKPDRKYGHSPNQVIFILDELGLDHKKWNKAFGVNTIAIDDDGVYNYYDCDVKTAIYKMTKGMVVKDYGWD
jgi:hypothetical protein